MIQNFFLIYDYAFSKEIYPYKHFDRFNLENFDNTQCLTEFRIEKKDLERLKNVLGIPNKLVCDQRTIVAWKHFAFFLKDFLILVA